MLLLLFWFGSYCSGLSVGGDGAQVSVSFMSGLVVAWLVCCCFGVRHAFCCSWRFQAAVTFSICLFCSFRFAATTAHGHSYDF